MTVTSTQSSDKGVVHRAVGSYISDAAAAAFDITTGFQPRYVRVTNEDGDCVMEWYEGMADSEGMKLVGDTTPVTYAKITSNGIIPLAYGFTVGLDTDVNVINQQLSWLALG